MKFIRETLISKTKQVSNEMSEVDIRKSELVRDMLDNVSPLIELSQGINSRSKGRSADDHDFNSGKNFFLNHENICRVSLVLNNLAGILMVKMDSGW